MFCGAGGSSYGARKTNVEIIAGFDHWEPAIKVFAANFPKARPFLNDIRILSPKKVRKEIGDVDLILASPECTDHSIAKGSQKRSELSKNTAFEVIRFAEEFRPTWIVIENVVRINKWDRYEEFLNKLGDLGYYINPDVILNAEDFGVPQSRIRRFILCSQLGKPEDIVPTTISKKTAGSIISRSNEYKFTVLRSKNRAEATIRKAEFAIESLKPKQPFLIVYYGSGKNGNGGWQELNQPLRTITTLDRFAYVVPENNHYKMRMLQPEELKLAMGYSNDFMLDSVEGITRREKVKLMGNGVCPPVMEAILEKLTKQKKN